MALGPVPGSFHLDKRALTIIDAGEGTDDDLLSTAQMAQWFGVCETWFIIRRRTPEVGPPYLRLSPQRVRYRRGAVKQWLAQRAFRSTDQYGNKAREQSLESVDKTGAEHRTRVRLGPDELPEV